MNVYLCTHCKHCVDIKYNAFLCEETGYLERKPIEEGCEHYERDDIETTKLRKVCERKKSEKYECTTCGGICYFPHSKSEIWYDFCPCCGRVVIKDDS